MSSLLCWEGSVIEGSLQGFLKAEMIYSKSPLGLWLQHPCSWQHLAPHSAAMGALSSALSERVATVSASHRAKFSLAV